MKLSERQLDRYKPVSVSAKFHSLARERGNNFQRVLEEGGICPPTRRRGLNGFLVGAVKRIKTRTDDEGGGPSLPKIRLCIKTLLHPLSKFAAQWYLTHLTCLMRNHESFSRINCFDQYLFSFFFFNGILRQHIILAFLAGQSVQIIDFKCTKH